MCISAWMGGLVLNYQWSYRLLSRHFEIICSMNPWKVIFFICNIRCVKYVVSLYLWWPESPGSWYIEKKTRKPPATAAKQLWVIPPQLFWNIITTNCFTYLSSCKNPNKIKKYESTNALCLRASHVWRLSQICVGATRLCVSSTAVRLELFVLSTKDFYQ